MNKKYFLLLSIAIVALLFASCKNNTSNKEDSLMEKMEELTQNYVKNEIKIDGLDSVQVVKIDTVDKYEYVNVVLDILLKMYNTDLAEYQSALETNDSTRINGLEVEIGEIEQATQYYEDMKKEVSEKDKTLLLYLVTANYYAKSNIDQFYFFATPDYKIYILDPFDSSILEK